MSDQLDGSTLSISAAWKASGTTLGSFEDTGRTLLLVLVAAARPDLGWNGEYSSYIIISIGLIQHQQAYIYMWLGWDFGSICMADLWLIFAKW